MKRSRKFIVKRSYRRSISELNKHGTISVTVQIVTECQCGTRRAANTSFIFFKYFFVVVFPASFVRFDFVKVIVPRVEHW